MLLTSEELGNQTQYKAVQTLDFILTFAAQVLTKEN
jgi:hypothetical protein